MKIDYWRLFLLALAILAGMIVYRWFAHAGSAFSGILPSSHNNPRYNTAAWVMFGLGVWGLVRVLRPKRHRKDWHS